MENDMARSIGKVAATEKIPTTIDEFFFWTDKQEILNPFDVIKAEHIEDSVTFGVIEEISHITDAASYLTSFISNDFGDITSSPSTHRIGMNFVKAKMVGNTKNIFTPVLDGSKVSLADGNEVKEALGLDQIKNPLPCGYLKMYSGKDEVQIPVHLNENFLLGPEGAHLNISGISGLAAKTSYAMFLTRAIQSAYLNGEDKGEDSSVAFVFFNVKGNDILAIDEPNKVLSENDKKLYEMMELENKPFEQVTYFYPYMQREQANTYAPPDHVEKQIKNNTAYKYKFIFEFDKDNIDLFFAHDDDPTETMASIINYILGSHGKFDGIRSWRELLKEVDNHCKPKYEHADKSIPVGSWRKFKSIS